ncbi:MerR family transcriptional regulator [Nocardia sp. NEAU-G5]|uniref:MerR family transcriptional regulator n=1 Tax=Nocardia albiluteola TaxID=2842303 RepID=A0ABS6B5I0_9NOCA|nr:MerR family transcriptional regulator [Nocardia albiluteola]MBU3064600.1 MerR family transcriptional regulator [Nocardia albiluteola]
MTTDEVMKIGDAAAVLGIEAHVLRHWESMGVLVPGRTPSGHRSYDGQTLDQARVIRTLQRTGLSLEQIRELGVSTRDERVARVAARRAEVRERIALLQATDRFLDHLAACRHPVIAECPQCAEFVAAEHPMSRFPAQP